MVILETPIEKVPKISKKIVPQLKHLRIRTIRDLLYYFPFRYEDFSNQKQIADILIDEVVTIQGKIKKITSHRTAKKHVALTNAVIEDDTGVIKAVWFNQPFLTHNLKTGDKVSISGKIVLGPEGPCFQNPAYERITNYESRITNKKPGETIHTGRLVPMYPETEGISSRWIRFLIKSFLDQRHSISDPLPEVTRARHTLPEVKDSIRAIHFPDTREEAEDAKRRFAFEKILFMQLRALHERARLKQHRAPAIILNVPILKEFVRSLPFDLTDAQRRSIWEIAKDISKSRPMNRLLEGDVGSGKTVVAAAAALITAKSGFHSAFMAPTEILAQQHFETLKKILTPFRLKIGILTGSAKRSDDAYHIVVGTHAIIQKNVRFSNLGLVVVDEQHRFGVEQRARLATRRAETSHRDSSQIAVGSIPHFLSMTATPIPRTLALALYSDLDISLLDEMPKSRKEVITQIVAPGKRQETYEFIRKEVKVGRQAFVVCPRIEIGDQKSEVGKIEQKRLMFAEVKAVTEEYKKLSEVIFSDLKVAMLHGKMKPKEKEKIMGQFRDKKIDVLVSTSVIEVGVDIPNATIMMIEGAERFGLATLHQFRGRVGRGQDQSYCFLFSTEDGMVTNRLHAVVEAKTGFELAEKDLQIRGPGDIFGTNQSGYFREDDIRYLADVKFIHEIRREVADIIKKSPDLNQFPELRKKLAEFERALHLE